MPYAIVGCYDTINPPGAVKITPFANSHTRRIHATHNSVACAAVLELSSLDSLRSCRVRIHGPSRNLITGSADQIAVGLTGAGGLINSHNLLLKYKRKSGRSLLPTIDAPFSVVVADASRRRLLLARDCLGSVPLYFRVSGPRVTFSSIPHLIAPSVVQFNNEVLSEYVSGVLPSPYETAFHGIWQVPPGSVLCGTVEGFEIRRWWSDSLIPCPKDPAKIDALFEQLFSASVQNCIIRTSGEAPFVQLSGGYDSTCVLAMLAQLGKPLRAANAIFPLRGATEERFVQSIQKRFSIVTVTHKAKLNLADAPMPSSQARFSPWVDVYEGVWANLYQRAKLKAWDVGLTGAYGDDFMSQFGSPVEMEAWLGGQFLRRRLGYEQPSSLLKTEFKRQFAESAVRHLTPANGMIRLDSLDLFLGWGSSTEAELLYETQLRHGLPLAFPFLDESLMKFSRGLPVAEKTSPGKLKPLLRRYLERMGINEVATRNNKADLSPYLRAVLMRSMALQLLQSPLLEFLDGCGLFDIDRVLTAAGSAHQHIPRGRKSAEEIVRVWQAAMFMASHSGDGVRR